MVLTAPWFLWNLRHFGSLVQVSGLVKLRAGANIFGALPAWGASFGDHVRALAHRLLAPVLVPTRFLIGEEFHSSAMTPVATIAIALLYLLPVPALFPLLRDRRVRVVFAFAATWMLTHLILVALVLGSYASWYCLPFFALMTTLTVMGWAVWLTRGGGYRRAGFAQLSLLAVAALITYSAFATRVSCEPMAPTRRLGPRLASIAATAPGSVVGAFNAGALGYVGGTYDHLRVTNLDGLVNNAVYRALNDGRYLSYVEQTVDVMFESPERASMFLSDADVAELQSRFRKGSDGVWYRIDR